MRVLKQRVSRHLRRKLSRRTSAIQLSLLFGRLDHALPQFWQPRFYDFNVWTQKRFVEKLQYMRVNPMKRKLFAHP